MKAVCWHGAQNVRVETVPDPQLLSQSDVIVRTTLTAICGSDLHLYDGYIPSMQAGDILGHEFMGEVIEAGREVKNLKKGDRVVVPFAIACGSCFFCRHDLFSQCDNSNPNAWMLEKLNGYGSAGLFGYSHLYGGYAGGQAQYVRVPFADVGPVKVSNGASRLSDEKVLFLSDIFPTGYEAAEHCDIKQGDTVAVWGCGPVGQFAMMSARLLGAGRVIGIDRFPERLRMAESASQAVTIDYSKSSDVVEETPASTRLAWKRTARVSRGFSTARSRRFAFHSTARQCCASVFRCAERVARFPSRAYTRGRSTTFRSARRSASRSRCAWARRMCRNTCARCSVGSSAARSIHRSSSPTGSVWRTPLTPTSCFGISRTVASKWCSTPAMGRRREVIMQEKKDEKDPQRDREDRPKPSLDPVEGDEETIEEDLKQKSGQS